MSDISSNYSNISDIKEYILESTPNTRTNSVSSIDSIVEPSIIPIQVNTNSSTAKHMSSMSNTTKAIETGPDSLPFPGTKNAPRKFKGGCTKVKPFFQHYERLLAQKQIQKDEEKIKNISQYCSREVREFVEGLGSFSGNDWDRFKTDIMKYYEAIKSSRRYRVTDLTNFVKRTAEGKPFNGSAKWNTYFRNFIRISGYLVKHNRINENVQNTMFWIGIPLKTRRQFERFLVDVKNPHDMETPFTWTSVAAVS